eukprot:1608089-Alexandrium_andersonii.AAC.1
MERQMERVRGGGPESACRVEHSQGRRAGRVGRQAWDRTHKLSTTRAVHRRAAHARAPGAGVA